MSEQQNRQDVELHAGIGRLGTWAFIGFENVAHFSEEFNYPVRKVRPVIRLRGECYR